MSLTLPLHHRSFVVVQRHRWCRARWCCRTPHSRCSAAERGSLEGSFSAGSTATIATKYSFFQVFRNLQSPLSGEKKVQALFFSRKKNTFGGELRLRRPSRHRRASRAPLGLPTPDPRSTLGQPSVNPRSTLGQRSVSSLAISDRFSLILQVSSIETEDKRTCVCKMVDFPIRKWDFRVCGWSGVSGSPWREKKEKTKCIYKICILLHRSDLKISAKNRRNF